MTHRVPGTASYVGVGMDAWCFIAAQTGLRYQVQADRQATVAEKIALVQRGDADVLLSLSNQPERAEVGLFTPLTTRATMP